MEAHLRYVQVSSDGLDSEKVCQCDLKTNKYYMGGGVSRNRIRGMKARGARFRPRGAPTISDISVKPYILPTPLARTPLRALGKLDVTRWREKAAHSFLSRAFRRGSRHTS